MKISANEMLLINKNLKFKGEEAGSAPTTTALADVVEGQEESISALNAQSMNNIAFQGVNMASLKKMGLNAMAALTLLSGAAAMTSCTDEPGGNTYITDNTQVITNITVNIYMTDEELVKAVLEEIKALREEQKEQTEINRAILEALLEQGISMDRILKLLEDMNMTAQDIFNMLKENTEKQDEILNEISKGNSEFKAMLTEILNAIKDGNKLSAENNKTLTMILAQMGQADKNDQTLISLLNNILNKINESIQNDKEIAMQQQKFFQAILAKLDSMDNNMKQSILALLNKLDSISEKNIELLTKIFNSIEEGKDNDGKTNEILLAILNKVQESIDQNHDLTEKTHELMYMIMDKISKLDDNMKNGMLDIIKHIDEASEANVNLLIKLIVKIENIDNGDEETTKVLYAILAKIEASIEQNKEMDSKTHQLLQSILDNVQGLKGDLAAAVEALLSKLDQMTEQNKVFLEQILTKLDNIDANGQKGLALILEQLAINNSISADMLNKIDQVLTKLDRAHEDDQKFYNQALALLAELVSKVDKLGDKADAILDAIGNISLDVNVDLSTIERMLADILDQSKVNGDVLTSIESKLNLVAITLEGIKTQIEINGGDNKAILDKLDEILAKIPDKCNCDKDLKIIIEILKKIAEEVGKGNNHEGILDDLEDLFD